MTGSGWKDAEEARRRAREAVENAFARTPDAAPERRCPNCGQVAATLDARCPYCDKRYDRRLPWLKDWMRWAIAGVVAAALVALAISLRPGIEETKRERADRLAREQAARVEAQRARLLREQRPVSGRLPEVKPAAADAPPAARRQARRAMVLALERVMADDARRRIARKQMDGPVKFVECGPLVRTADPVADDAILTKRLGRYDCVAVKRDVRRFGRTVALFGHPYVATIDFERATYTFCKDNKVPGERGKALATVTLAPECFGLDENAERVGGGYVMPEE